MLVVTKVVAFGLKIILLSVCETNAYDIETVKVLLKCATFDFGHFSRSDWL